MSKNPKLPCIGIIGCGYQVASGKYANADSCEEQLFDFGEELRLKVDYAGFSGSIGAEFSKVEEYSTHHTFTRLQYNEHLYIIKLNDADGEHQKYLKSKVRDDIRSLDPMALYDRYGTHYISNFKVGGRCISTAITNTLKCSKAESFSTYLRASYSYGGFDAKAAAEIKTEGASKSFIQNSELKSETHGGRPEAYGTDSTPNLEAWIKTVKENPIMIDFNSSQGLLPIWKLAESKDRKDELKKALQDYIKLNSIQFKLETVVLEGRYVSSFVQYNDDSSHADRNVSVFKPNLGAGWFWLGQKEQSKASPEPRLLAVRPKAWGEGALSPIGSFQEVWSDSRSKHYETDCEIWNPIPENPVEYEALGN